MAYDQAKQTAILFGGFNTSAGRLGDTWSWNGATWTHLRPATSLGVITTAWQAAYDTATRQILVSAVIRAMAATSATRHGPGRAPPGFASHRRNRRAAAATRQWPTTPPRTSF